MLLSASIVSPNGEFLGIKMTARKILLNVIDSNGQESVVTSDFDGDIDIDIISSGKTVSWYENNGNGTFSKRV